MSDFVALFLLIKLDAEWYWWGIFTFWLVAAYTGYEVRWNRVKEFLDREDVKEQEKEEKKKPKIYIGK